MPTDIPLPAPSIMARWIVPLLILAAALGTLLFSGFEALRPAAPVRVAPVLLVAPPSDDGQVPPQSGGDSPAAPDAASTAAPDTATPAAPAAPPAPSRWIQAPGWIEPDPHPCVVSALRDGIIEEILVLEGDAVARGAPVARLESREAALALARARAELARAESDRARFISTAEEARAEEAQLPYRRAAAQARYDAAKDASERADRLAVEHAVGEGEVVKFRQLMLETRADLEAIEPRARAIAAAIRAADAEAASATLVPQAAVDQAALALERSTVVAPIDGVVMQMHAVPGQNLMAGDLALGRAVVTLYDPRKLRVRADVPLADAAGLSVGHRAKVTVEILPDRVFEGVVSRIDHRADIQKNTVSVRVSLLDPSPELKPDMLARVRIAAGTASAPAPTDPAAPAGAASARGTLLAPSAALLGDGEERRALVVTGLDRGRGRLELRRVRVEAAPRAERDGWIAVRSGLAAGDRLVLEPPEWLGDGDAVRVVEDGEGAIHAAR